jgi:SAM-dependent methyltransferase
VSQPWYEIAFGAHYLDVYAHRDEQQARREVAFVLQALDLPPHARVLDLACGNGRHLKALRLAGLDAVGVDLSAALLRQAREHDLPVARADMRRLPLPAAHFDAVVNLFTSFGYFQDEQDNAVVLHEVARVLRPGGRLLMDHINGQALRSGLVPQTRREVGGRTIFESRRWLPESRRVEKTVAIRGGGAPDVEYVESVRVYSPDELTALLRRAGMEVQSWFGGLDGSALSDTSARMVVVAGR